MYICLCFMNKCRYTCLVSMWPKCPRTICVLWSSLRNASLLKRCWEIRQSPRDYTPKAPSRLFSTKTLIIWLNLLEYWGTFSRKDAYVIQTQTTLLYTLNSYSMPFISSSLSPLKPLQAFATMSRGGSAPCSSSHWWKMALDFSFRLECNYCSWSAHCFFI